MRAHPMVGAQRHGVAGEVEQPFCRDKEVGGRLGMGQAVNGGAPLRTRGDKAAVIEACQVLGDRGLRPSQVLRKFNHLVLTEE